MDELTRLLNTAVDPPPLRIGDERLQLTAEVGAELRGRLSGWHDWSVRRLLKEAYLELLTAVRLAQRGASGAVRAPMGSRLTSEPACLDDKQLVIDRQQVMQAWERPYMVAMAQAVSRPDRDVLEVGFGMGILADAIQQLGARSHTIVECHPDVLRRCGQWRSRFAGRDIRIVEGRWQDVLGALGVFDAIVFDAYPLDEQEWTAHYVEDVTYARHFFAAAAAHLRAGGVFSYYSNEIDSMSRAHQRALLEHYRSLSIRRIDGLAPPPDCHYWQTSSMLLITAHM